MNSSSKPSKPVRVHSAPACTASQSKTERPCPFQRTAAHRRLHAVAAHVGTSDTTTMGAGPARDEAGKNAASGSAVSKGAPGAMEDEYSGTSTGEGSTHVFRHLLLESGRTLNEVPVFFRTWGTLNKRGTNAIVVCHALTGNADADSWWNGLLGPGKALDTDRYMVFCSNVLGSCYGTCGPTSVDPASGLPYGGDFPLVTVRDSVHLHQRVLNEVLHVKEVVAVIGGSMGGMQALEWTFSTAPTVRSSIAIACNGRHSPWQIGFSECQRQAIFADPAWKNGRYKVDEPPVRGLQVARQIAMISYRTHNAYATKFGRRLLGGAESTKIEDRKVADEWYKGTLSDVYEDEKKVALTGFEVQSYLNYQGQSFVKRKFDATTYVVLTHLMDSHDLSRGRGEYTEVLTSIRCPVLVIGIQSDVLYPYPEQEELSALLGNSEFHLVYSDEGHDGFLLEQAQLDPLIKRFLLKVEIERKEEAHVAGLTEQVESLKSMVAELRGSQRTGGI